MNNDLILSYTLEDGKPQMYGYFIKRSNGRITSGLNETPEQAIRHLKDQYGDRLIATNLEDEIEFFKRDCDYLIPKEISEERYNELFNILPPRKMYHSESVHAFMFSEPLAINLYDHFVHFPKLKKCFQIAAFGNTPITDVIKTIHC
ncbi:MAG: hypothetical protein JNJ87_11445 [Acinetobacter junii]|nr:hypothetical protein [Acinetobacter junii]